MVVAMCGTARPRTWAEPPDRTAHVRADYEVERPLPHDVVFSVQSRISSSTEKAPRSSPHSPTTLLQHTDSVPVIRVTMLSSYSSRVLRTRLNRPRVGVMHKKDPQHVNKRSVACKARMVTAHVFAAVLKIAKY